MNCVDMENFDCCGCAACANICPKDAIIMKENEEGFYIPFIDKDKCTNCGLCTKKCPQLNHIEKNTKTPDCYAVMADDELRKKSSSGGAFGVIADEILNRGGVICGVAFDENWTVKHIIVDNREDLEKLRGSKYVQSFVSETLMKDIKTILDNNRWVLFTGCPCHVSGLKSFLGKDYEKLLLVDLICSKVPPKKVFDKFLADNYSDEQILDIQMRSKVNGWGCNFTTTTRGLYTSHYWFKMFLNSLSMNESCVNCKYMSIDRVGDITIGDFWGIEKIKPELNDQKGTSLILINTPKGQQFFNNLDWQIKEQMTTQNAIDGNRALLVPFIPHQNRKLFMDKALNNNFNKTVDDSLSIKHNVGILNWWWNSNRGAILTCYAIQEVVKELGYNPSVIKHIPFEYYNSEYKNSISEKFADKYLNLTEWCHSRIDMRKLNEKFDTFMVGSDQIWNHDFNWFLQDFYYLNFVELDKNKIACAASFGPYNYFTGNNTITKMVEYYFKRFNNISVREKAGADILKTTFNIDGTFILDPVLLIDKQKYEYIIKDVKKEKKKYIAAYFINNNTIKQELLKKLSKETGLSVIDIKAEGLTVEEWLYYIKNSELVISDSFHASCFSIIFNKNFLTTFSSKPITSDQRLMSLAEITGLHNRFVNSQKFSISELIELGFKDENWTLIQQNIEPLKMVSRDWLKNSLVNDVNKNYSKEQVCIEAFYASMDDRLNFVESQVISLACSLKQCEEKNTILKEYIQNQINELTTIQQNIICKDKIIFKYHMYHLLSGIFPTEKLKNKKRKYQEKYNRLKTI